MINHDLKVVSLTRPSKSKQHGNEIIAMVEHLQSGDQAMAPEDSAWQAAMSHFNEIGCIMLRRTEVFIKYDV